MAYDPSKISDFKFPGTIPKAEETYFKGIIYSPPGRGKSTLAASAANVEGMAPLLYLSIDQGERSIIDAGDIELWFPEKSGGPQKINIPTPHIIRWDEINDPNRIDLAWDTLDAIRWKLLSDINKGEKEFNTLVIDTGTELQRKHLDLVVDRDMKRGKSRELDVLYQADWLQNMKGMRRIFQGFLDLPMHIIVPCHETEKKNEMKQVELTVPAFPPALLGAIHQMFDYILYLDLVDYPYEVIDEETKEKRKEKMPVRKLISGQNRFLMTKDHSPGEKLAKKPIYQPTFEKIMAAING